MKKILIFLVLAMLVAGCAQDLEHAQPLTGADDLESTPEIRTRSLDGALYNEVTDAWMAPQKDPYALENFQKAYDNLAAQKSTQTLSKAMGREFAASKKLEPTHYALKIYPKSEEEQSRVERMKDVQVVYIPFDYVQLTEQEVEKLPAAKTRSTAVFTEKSPSTVTYDYSDVTDGGPTDPVTYQLPILYTVWPVSKPLPEDLEYVVDYEIFLPRAAAGTKSVDALRVLESEAQLQALGYVTPMPVAETTGKTRAASSVFMKGNLSSYDNVLGTYITLRNLRIDYQVGSNIQNMATDILGNIYFYVDLPNQNPTNWTIPINIVYIDPNSDLAWKITTENSTNPYTVSTSLTVSTSSYWPNKRSPGTRQENTIHRALDFFYYYQVNFPKYLSWPNMFRVIAYSTSNNLIDGSFSPYHTITIYHNGQNAIGTTLHNLAHYTQYTESPSDWFYPREGFIIESFGSFLAWYLGEMYYELHGWINPGGLQEIAGPARQTWKKTNNTKVSNYNLGWDSPLFIDLVDDYNQQTMMGSSYPKDVVHGLPPNIVWQLVRNTSSWAQCKAKIQSYIGTYYTDIEVNNWIIDFNDWVYIYNK